MAMRILESSVLLLFVFARLASAGPTTAPSLAAAAVCPAASAIDSIMRPRDSCSDADFLSNASGGDPVGVMEGDEASLQRALSLVQKDSHQYASVLFYASWCPFSKTLRPNFTILSSLFPTIHHFAVEESSIRPSILSRYGVHGFPTLFLLNCTTRVRYHGPRTLDSLVLFYNGVTEEERDPYRIPTKQNILMALRWLVMGCQPGDSLVFHYSGHGSQQINYHGDEVDGHDETLCPVDYETVGMIVDDEINATIVRPLPKGVKLHAIIDACHSGTVLDLPFLCRMNRAGFYQWENHNPLSGVYKGTSGGLAISFSGCDDNQTSADTTALSGDTMTGAMTFCFIQAVNSEPGMTYGRILTAMRSAIRDTNTGIRIGGPIASFIRTVIRAGLKQEPQLSSTEQFDIYRTPFLL